MNDTMREHSPRQVRIPSLVALGDQFSLVAASAIVAERRRAPAFRGLVFAPAFAIVVALIMVSVQLSPPAEATVMQAAARTATHETGRFVMRTLVRPTGAAAIDLSTSGVYDRASGRLQSTVDTSRLFGGSAPAGDAGRPVTTIKDGTLVYLQADVFTAMLPSHRPWVVVDTARLDPASGLAVTGEVDATITDPSSFLQALQGIGDDARVLGREDVGGVSTARYHGTVSLARASARLSAIERDRLREGFANMGLSSDDLVMPVDVWVDEGGEVRRVETTLDLTPAGATPTGTAGASPATPVTVTIDYLDLSGPTSIVLPTAGDVSDITELVNEALGGPLKGATPG